MKKHSFLWLLCLLSGGSMQSQNNCVAPQVITAGNTQVNAIDGTNISTGCSTATMAKWYAYTPTQNYWVTISSDMAINACIDTHVAVYTGTCSGLVCIGDDDDSGVIACPSTNTSFLSIYSFNAIAGTTYLIAWDNKWSSTGFTFSLTEGTPPPASPVQFTASTIPTSSTICCVVDMNNDYRDDVVTVSANALTVLEQQPQGGFTTKTYTMAAPWSTTPGWSIAAGDFDRNGYNDLVFGGSSRLCLAQANADGSAYTEVTYPQNIFTQRTNFVDINNDGHLDLWACHDVAQSHAYRNDGQGHLNFDISLMPTLPLAGNYQSTWTDINNDGKIDMYLAKCRGGAVVGDPQRINLLYINQGGGTFVESGAAAGVNDGAQSWSSAIEDFDNDGDLDILISNISDQNRLYRNNGDGTFTDIYTTTGIDPQVGSWEVQAHDFNNDGWIDFFWQNGKELYLNNGDMTFTGYDLPFGKGAVGDLNHDGFLDVQYSNVVYYNTPNANHWLTVHLQGVQSNRNGIGARLEIYGTWGKQIREIRSGSGFSQQSSLNAHFGLGAAEQIDKIVIKWPSGIVDEIVNPIIDQPVLVTEGQSLDRYEAQWQTFQWYPNPAQSNLYLQYAGSIDGLYFRLFDMSGRSIHTDFQPNTQSFDVQSLQSGAYLIQVTDASGNAKSFKFIKE